MPPRVAALDDPTQPAELVALARDALTCDWTASGFTSTCPQLERFRQGTSPPNRPVGLMVGMLEDDSERVRWLGAAGLSGSLDVAQQERLFSAASKERSGAVAIPLGIVVGSQKLASPEHGALVEKLVLGTELVALRSAVAGRLLPANRTSVEALRLTTGLLKDRDQGVVAQAIRALRSAEITADPIACETLGTLFGHPENGLATAAAVTAATLGCKGQIDAIIELYWMRLANPAQLVANDVNDAAESICKLEPVEAQRKAAVKLVLRAAANKDLKSGMRAHALEVAALCLTDAAAEQQLKPFEKSDDELVVLMAKKLASDVQMRRRAEKKSK